MYFHHSLLTTIYNPLNEGIGRGEATLDSYMSMKRSRISSSFSLATTLRPKGRSLYRSWPKGTVAMGYPERGYCQQETVLTKL